ncbi:MULTISPECIES: N-acetylglucosamine-specific PTS transporter subunit IIBC [Lactiplantibacillus]|uniref:N-acetylglucosamine-specific PTS transporter subunit IIBC n=1 Tax=Lactiplantibacillus pentosus TaxID=1589 RepID=A0AAP5PX17_LACPE|nr:MULTISPECIES: N-acetylglucosamine-specific PTS transporter subunit IIBC [Lactiplantibacillus]AUI78117.1 PTS N-acetylglucosamine transporter subunit IIABC [Lactiplantibacillus pentosus]MBU7461982.1 N-acetylglucosamine-specific PTS transporter subunit IIBC [Lactiplantibacillus pentosus]MBU7463995.1 N-acetylglucosamine-specific PTS transporter subunit IIBC [Lactiplantibacillus pentosus]MBU7473472.1 N-acetylglucosamine-specific PTS transporter subunit IIBC [Lactiplantibacillus pentosus]MBU74780
MKTYFQKIGQSLMLPIATLPAAAILVGIGNYLPKQWLFANYLIQGGDVVLNNLALLFAVGLAIGMSVNKDGAAAIAGLIAFEVPVTVLKPATLATMLNVKASQINPAFSALDNNVLIGISAGLIAAALYNRFHEVKLPMALSFFSGKRLVPIMAAFVMLIVTAALYFVWPFVYDAIVLFATGISKLGFVGAGLYGFFNRLLIPTGLHHALNSVFWYNVAGINDIGNFWASHGVKGITGMYEAGFFPIMMFGLPAGAYAIYRNARPERKKEVGSLMLAGAFASFFTGVTEPLEFSFMFVAWPLYLLHAVFMGLSLGFAALMHWTASFSFSGGLVDYLLSFRMPLANQPYMLLVQGVVMAVIYYFGFDFAIKRFNLRTPGREAVTAGADATAAGTTADHATTPSVAVAATDDKYMRQAKQIYAAIGGHDNISVINNCTTRLRLQLKDTAQVDQPAVMAAGVPGLNVLDVHNIHIVIGTEVQFVAEALQQLFSGQVAVQSATATTEHEKVATNQSVSDDSAATDNEAVPVTTVLHAPATGQLMPISDVADETFAGKLLGDGYAVEPEDGEIVAPVSGTVTSVFPTKHAIGLKTASGLEILLHMGINTVEMNGTPFTLHVVAGDELVAGRAVATVDLAAIKAAGKATTMMVVITNMDHVTNLTLNPKGHVTSGDLIGAAE